MSQRGSKKARGVVKVEASVPVYGIGAALEAVRVAGEAGGWAQVGAAAVRVTVRLEGHHERLGDVLLELNRSGLDYVFEW